MRRNLVSLFVCGDIDVSNVAQAEEAERKRKADEEAERKRKVRCLFVFCANFDLLNRPPRKRPRESARSVYSESFLTSNRTY